MTAVNSILAGKGVKIAPAQECAKYQKYLYILPRIIDQALIDDLLVLGEFRLQTFSQFNPMSRDLFEISNTESMMKLQGTIGSELLYVVVHKMNPRSAESVDRIVAAWLDR